MTEETYPVAPVALIKQVVEAEQPLYLLRRQLDAVRCQRLGTDLACDPQCLSTCALAPKVP
jgi:hypothetical protein